MFLYNFPAGFGENDVRSKFIFANSIVVFHIRLHVKNLLENWNFPQAPVLVLGSAPLIEAKVIFDCVTTLYKGVYWRTALINFNILVSSSNGLPSISSYSSTFSVQRVKNVSRGFFHLLSSTILSIVASKLSS